MADIDVIEQKPVTMAELKAVLDSVKKDKGELNFRAEKVHNYLNHFVDKVNVEELKKKLDDLEITKLRDRHIIKIIDMMPNDLDSLKVIFAGETVSLKQDEMQKVLDAINS
jgi:DNA-directed RNA polymerase subunit F